MVDNVEKARSESQDLEIRMDREKSAAFTDRNLAHYCEVFGFQPEDLKDQVILDVGSGKKETFAKEAAKYGAEVHSMSPALTKWLARRHVKGLIIPDKQWQKRSVAGRSQEISFKDETFDMVTALWSVPYYLANQAPEKARSETAICVKEMIRVLKPGGKLFMSPEVNEQTIGPELIGWLEENHHSVDEYGRGLMIITKSNSDSTD